MVVSFFAPKLLITKNSDRYNFFSNKISRLIPVKWFRYTVLLVTFLLIASLNSNSQGSYNSDYSSFVDGSAASNNVNLYTGTLNVNVPIKTFNVSGYQLPVILSYDGSGVRVGQHPSWVGQNWNLACGGSIVRVVKNKVDEDDRSPVCYFKNYTKSILKKCSLEQIADSSTKTGYDFEPDEFIFNFMGYSGTFLLDNDGQWKVKSNNHIQVIFDVNYEANYRASSFPSFSILQSRDIYHSVIAGFVLKTTDGTTYYFGYDYNAIEYQAPFYDISQIKKYPGIASTWYLTRVIDRFHNEVYSFKYSRGLLSANFYRNDGTVNTPNVTDNNVVLDPYTSETTESNYCPSKQVYTNIVRGKLISPVYLESVYSNGNLLGKFNTEFSNEKNYRGSVIENNITYKMYDLRWMKLSSITIPSDSVNVVFSYNDSRGLVNRLCLENISLKSYSKLAPTDINNNATYTFRYNNFDLIPDYLSTCSDAWGYCSTPYTLDKNNLDKFERNFDFEKVKYGSLARITYPNGKYSLFDFEPHEFNSFINRFKKVECNYVYSSEVASGLRIKKIYDYDGVNMRMKYYTYLTNRGTINQMSSGILYSKPRYYEKDETNGRIYFSINSLVPLSSLYDSFISYSNVQEHNQDESYTDCVFSNFTTNMDIAPAKVYYMPNDYDVFTGLSSQRGLLTEKKSYNTAGELNYYSKKEYEFSDGKSIVLASSLKHEFNCDGKQDFMGGKYYYEMAMPIITHEIEHKIIGSSSFITDLVYTYKYFNSFPYLNCVTKSTKTASEKKTYSYTFDDDVDGNVNELTNSFVVKPIRTIESRNGKLFKINQTSFFNLNEEIYPSSIVEKNLGGVSNTITYNSYDEFGHNLDVIYGNGISNMVLYGYNFQYPVIRIRNIKMSDFEDYIKTKGIYPYLIQTTLLSDQLKIMVEKILDGFKAKFPQATINCFIYNNGLMSRRYDDKDNFMDYTYDHYLRLKTVTDKSGNILKSFNYNFDSFKEYDGYFYNTAESKVFVKNNCDCNLIGNKYLYKLPSKIYSSTRKEGIDSQINQLFNGSNCEGQRLANATANCNKPYARIDKQLISTRYVVLDDATKLTINGISDIYLNIYCDPYYLNSFKPNNPIPIKILKTGLVEDYPVKTIISANSPFPMKELDCYRENCGIVVNRSYNESTNLLLKSETVKLFKEQNFSTFDRLRNVSGTWRLGFTVTYLYQINSSVFETTPKYYCNKKVNIEFENKIIDGFKQVRLNFELPFGLFKSVNSQGESDRMAADSIYKFKVKYPFFNSYVKTNNDDIASFNSDGIEYFKSDSEFTFYSTCNFNDVTSDAPWLNYKLEHSTIDNKFVVRLVVGKNNSGHVRVGNVIIHYCYYGPNGKENIVKRIVVIQDDILK